MVVAVALWIDAWVFGLISGKQAENASSGEKQKSLSKERDFCFCVTDFG
jgi:hypothetical protein